MFITIEGIEGAGKSTLRTRLPELLSPLNKEIIITREPGATSLGLQIRSMILDPNFKNTSNLAELMLFAADRAQHVEELILPALKRGAIVLCDRYTHSTLAYQGYGSGLDLNQLLQINNFITRGLKPDLVLLLDLPVEEGLKRAELRTRKASGIFKSTECAQSWNKFEEKNIEYHKKVRAGFLTLAKDPALNFKIVDALDTPENIAQAAYQHVLGSIK